MALVGGRWWRRCSMARPRAFGFALRSARATRVVLAERLVGYARWRSLYGAPPAESTRQCWSERRTRDDVLKFGAAVQRVQDPSGQNLTSRSVVSLAIEAATLRLKCRQTNAWAAISDPEMSAIRCRGNAGPEGSIFHGALVRHGRTGGDIPSGTHVRGQSSNLGEPRSSRGTYR